MGGVGKVGKEGLPQAPRARFEAGRCWPVSLEGKVPAIFVADREDDISTALRIAREFSLKPILAQATEGYLARDVIRRAGVPVIVGPTSQRMDALQTENATLENAALLADVGIPVAFSSGFEDYVPKNHVLLFEAAIAAGNGMGRDRALEAATIGAARILGIADRVGSLEPGKDADLALFDGDPFEYTSHVEAIRNRQRPVHANHDAATRELPPARGTLFLARGIEARRAETRNPACGIQGARRATARPAEPGAPKFSSCVDENVESD